MKRKEGGSVEKNKHTIYTVTHGVSLQEAHVSFLRVRRHLGGPFPMCCWNAQGRSQDLL